MRRNIFLVILVFSVCLGYAQENSKDNQFNKSWEVNSTWVDNSAPGYTNVGSAVVDMNIYGYVSLGSSSTPRDLTFEGGHPTLTFTVRDTLVVYGDMIFNTDAMTLSVPAGGLLIVFGKLDVNNKVDIANGGNIVVTGEFKLTGAQADVTVAGAGTFYAGSYSTGAQSEVGNGPPDPSLNAGSDLQANLPSVYQFVQNNGATPLPVELIDFSAEFRGNAVNLKWATASELNFDHFSVERSSDGLKFEQIATVRGNGTTKERHDYSYTDYSPLVGNSYYRLKSIDFDGYTEIFNMILVNSKVEKNAVLSPIPVTTSNLSFHLNFEPSSDILVTVTTAAGIERVRGVIKSSEMDADLGLSLEPGVYIVKMTSLEFNKVSRIVVR